MSRIFYTLLASALLISAACKEEKKQAAKAPSASEAAKPAEGAKAPDNAPPAGAEDLDKAGAEILVKLADLLDANKGNCGKMAAELKAFGAANKDTLAKMKEHWEKKTSEQKEATREKFKTEFAALEHRGESALKTCGKDKDVDAAFEALGL